jgi:ACDE family multidrug resistance protein
MEWSRTGMFLITAGLTLFVGFLCLVLIHVSKKEPSNKKDTLFEKLQLT